MLSNTLVYSGASLPSLPNSAMPLPISLDTFRQLARVGSNAEIRMGDDQAVTTAPRRFGGRLIQQLLTGLERDSRQHIATEFLRGLEAAYGKDAARQAFQAVRKDLQAGAQADTFRLGAKPLTARQVHAILQRADGLRNQSQVSALRDLTARYDPDTAIVRDLAVRREAPIGRMTPAHWQVFKQLLAEGLADERVKTGALPSTQASDRLAGKMLAHVARLSEDELLAGVQARQRMRSQGQALLSALAGQPTPAGQAPSTAAAQIDAFLDATRSDLPLIRDFLAGSQEELGKDGRIALDRMALNLTLNSLTPALASEWLAAMKAPGSDFRHLYSAINLLPNAPGVMQREGYLAACGEVGDLLDNVLSNLARRAGEDPAELAAAFQPVAEQAREADWAQVVPGPGFAAASVKAAGLASTARVRDQLGQLAPVMSRQAHRLASLAGQEVEETERQRRTLRSDLCESLGNALWELAQAGNDACIVKGDGAVTPHLQALLQAAGRELLHNPDVDLVQLAAQLRRAGVVHGRGALEDFNLSYQALQDLTPLAQREQPLDMDHLKAQATLFYRDPRVAEDLLKEFMIVAHS
jgi:hypothetical protein